MNLSTATRLTLAATMSMLAPVLVSGMGQDSTGVAMSASPTPSLSPISGSATSTSTVPGVTTSPKVHLVQVGAGGFHFEPAQLDNVSVGDVVTFEFYPPDHSVARAEYGKEPCMPYEYTGKDKIGFWSGTQWVNTERDVCYCCDCLYRYKLI
jgi:plastocyanin